jgi:hypothetical protein
MVDASNGTKCVTLRSTSHITIDLDHLPHISTTCANNPISAILSPCMILSHHATAISESNDVAAGRVCICTTPNACQTRKSFLIRTVCFCHWLRMYRASSEMIGSRASDCLFIDDGPTSRACPLTLDIFRCFRVHVLTLSSHTSHICQFCDVQLASLLKHAINPICRDCTFACARFR